MACCLTAFGPYLDQCWLIIIIGISYTPNISVEAPMNLIRDTFFEDYTLKIDTDL